VKRLIWIVVTLAVLLGSVYVPVRLHADGTGGGTCPNGKVCKPLDGGAFKR
jgi:hypothetical protein